MAAGTTRISDLVVPEIFTGYIQQITQEKSRLIQSRAVMPNALLDQHLSGAGLTFNVPSFKDLDNDEENVSNDDPTDLSTPNKIGSATEIQVRCSRNNSWAEMDLAQALAGPDPLDAIVNLVASYWLRRRQAMFVATMKGIFADNDAAPTGTEHVQYDLTHDVSGVGFVNGVTNFSAEAFIDTTATMGDSMSALSMIMVHSLVYARMQKNNLIDFIPDSTGMVNIPTFQGREVVVDDGVPHTGGVFQSWLFGAGAIQLGNGLPEVPTEVLRVPAAGKGSGQEILWNRNEIIMHPVGYAYVGTPANGGPSNAATANNLAHVDSWKRVFSERKQIQIARLITREF